MFPACLTNDNFPASVLVSEANSAARFVSRDADFDRPGQAFLPLATGGQRYVKPAKF